MILSHAAGIVTSRSIRYYNFRCPRLGTPQRIGDEKFKKNSLPTMHRRGPEAEVLPRVNNFCGLEVKESMYVWLE